MKTKRCTRCGEAKPLTEFPVNKRTKDGRGSWCLDCCVWQKYRFDSLDVAIGRNLTKYDKVTQPWPRNTDGSWEKVCMAMAYWLRDRTLKPAHVDVLMMRAIELLEWKDIAELVGLTSDTVKYHYSEAVRRLREKYAGMVEAS